jgi:hypothetical protein
VLHPPCRRRRSDRIDSQQRLDLQMPRHRLPGPKMTQVDESLGVRSWAGMARHGAGRFRSGCRRLRPAQVDHVRRVARGGRTVIGARAGGNQSYRLTATHRVGPGLDAAVRPGGAQRC